MHKMLNEYSYLLEKYDMLENMKNPVRETHDKEEEATDNRCPMVSKNTVMAGHHLWTSHFLDQDQLRCDQWARVG